MGSMSIETATRLFGELVFWPGWTFDVSDHCNRYENSIKVKVTYPAQDTGRENAATGYTEQEIPGGARAAYVIMLDKISCGEDLYAEILRIVADIRSHEDREALRVGRTLWAPFHPHATDGMERAQRYGLGTVRGDLAFGLA